MNAWQIIEDVLRYVVILTMETLSVHVSVAMLFLHLINMHAMVRSNLVLYISNFQPKSQFHDFNLKQPVCLWCLMLQSFKHAYH